MFASICWLLWKNRNKHVFEKVINSPDVIRRQAANLIQRIEAASSARVLGTDATLRRHRQEIKWEHPSQGWVALNSDGSVVNGQAAVGGVLRDENGRLIRAFSMKLGEVSITRSELEGIVKGLQVAWNEGLRCIIVQTDSQTAIKLIKEAENRHPHFLLVQEARRLLALDWQVQLLHVYREGNFVTDYLASAGHKVQQGIHFLEEPDPMLKYWLYFDLIGVETPRMVVS
ncbi:unnamed protein product [Linum trigynum]|uniref:RNase H type-1 domain-containing protein n=1 Tax=Linum trigynum TaxID=586398 RepID=A0AAV2DUK7_9ROSI